MKKKLKKLGLILLIIFILIQFIRPAKNINIVDANKQIGAAFTVPQNVSTIL